jgi:hypothetical protein
MEAVWVFLYGVVLVVSSVCFYRRGYEQGWTDHRHQVELDEFVKQAREE